jgi:hypothetical protein
VKAGLVLIRLKAHSQALRYRSIDDYIQSSQFESALNRADSDLYSTLVEAVEKGDKNFLLDFIRQYSDKSTKDIKDLNTRELRAMAQQLYLKDYYLLPKEILIREIENEIRRVKESVIRESSQPDQGQ